MSQRRRHIIRPVDPVLGKRAFTLCGLHWRLHAYQVQTAVELGDHAQATCKRCKGIARKHHLPNPNARPTRYERLAGVELEP